MPQRTAYLYEQGQIQERLSALLTSLGSLNVTLTDTETSSVSVVNEEGTSTSIKEVSFWATVERAGSISFLLQFSQKDRRYCRIRRCDGICVIELDLAGCNEDDVSALRLLLESHFVHHADAALGLVFDPAGAMEDYDWDKFFVCSEHLQQSELRNGPPDVIGLLRHDFGRLGAAKSLMRVAGAHERVVILRRT
jgi:hypothetical protein